MYTHSGSVLSLFKIPYIKTYPISCFHQEIIGGWIPFPVDILRNTDPSITWVNLEGSRCFVALESVIKRILDQAIESCIRIWGFYLWDRRLTSEETEMLASLFSGPCITITICTTKEAPQLSRERAWARIYGSPSHVPDNAPPFECSCQSPLAMPRLARDLWKSEFLGAQPLVLLPPIPLTLSKWSHLISDFKPSIC